MQKQSIYYTMPSITALEAEYAADAVENGWGSRCYEYITKFEALFREHIDTGYSIATSSCTGAMHLGLAALGVDLGDEVIIADTNWIATAAPIVHLGATPVMVDVLEDTWCIDPAKVEAAITPRTKAIIATHIYGNMCDLEQLLLIGKKYNIPIIEDAAEAIGSSLNSRAAGSMGLFGTFSFHGTKTITTGEGGMFVTNDPDLFEQVLTLSNHGRNRRELKQFWPEAVGFKYKMSNLQAAIGVAQLERIDELIEKKRHIFKYYYDRLADLPVQMNPEPVCTKNGYWMPTIIIDNDVSVSRETILDALKAENIDGRVFFWPLSSLPMFRKGTKTKTPLSYSLSERGINLPSYHDLTDSQMDTVTEIIRSCFNREK